MSATNNKNGFTLAEVLITLVVIGIIAAITIPALMKNTQNQELKTGLLKGEVVLTNALKLYEAKNGYKLVPSAFVYDDGDDRVYIVDEILPFLSKAKNCNKAGCVARTDEIYKTYNSSQYINHSLLDDGQLILSDGMMIFVENYLSNIYFSIDVNGYQKPPNKAGHDLFFFQLNPEGHLVPMGTEGTAYTECSLSSNSTGNGIGCTAKALRDSDYFKNLPR